MLSLWTPVVHLRARLETFAVGVVFEIIFHGCGLRQAETFFCCGGRKAEELYFWLNRIKSSIISKNVN